jgi:hypothetical protein
MRGSSQPSDGSTRGGTSSSAMYHQAVAILPCRSILRLMMPADRRRSRTEAGTCPSRAGLRLRPIHQEGRHRTEDFEVGSVRHPSFDGGDAIVACGSAGKEESAPEWGDPEAHGTAASRPAVDRTSLSQISKCHVRYRHAGSTGANITLAVPVAGNKRRSGVPLGCRGLSLSPRRPLVCKLANAREPTSHRTSRNHRLCDRLPRRGDLSPSREPALNCRPRCYECRAFSPGTDC